MGYLFFQVFIVGSSIIFEGVNVRATDVNFVLAGRYKFLKV